MIRGVGGTAGNIGHLLLDTRLATVCQCGRRGCLETVASAEAVRRTLSAAIATELDLDEVLHLVAEGHPVAGQVLDEAGEFVGRALGWVATILNPELIVLGGPLVQAGSALLDPVRRGLRQSVNDSVSATRVDLSPWGERAEAVGALVLALQGVTSAG